MTAFNGCLADLGLRFVGIPGQTDDPAAEEPDYLPALISCNNESGIGEVLQEQNERPGDLSPEQKKTRNEEEKAIFERLVDRGWDFGPLEPNENGILTASSFPDDINVRADEFARDLDACGWNDPQLG